MDDSNHSGNGLGERFRAKRSEHVQKQLARLIHTKVRDARSAPDQAKKRWPFELIQNAHDAGERHGRDGVTMTFKLIDGTLTFEHDGAPFEMDDLVALLEGGSSKDFESRETTGRFGTGFLVTHVLSEVVRVAGVLDEDGGHHAFEVGLNRPDNEDDILKNISTSESAVSKAWSISDYSSRPTATFEYSVKSSDPALAGLDMLEETLPHLFGSCPHLREVKIQRGNHTKCWNAERRTEPHERDGVWIIEVAASSYDERGEEAEWKVIQAKTDPEADGWLLLALRRVDSNWEVSRPGQVPSVFRQLPVLGGPALSTWVILDGEFDLDQERTSVHVDGEHGRPVSEAFAALEGLALVAAQEGWGDGYRVAQLAAPENLDGSAKKVWHEILSSTAKRLSHRPLVETFRAGTLPAVQTEGVQRWTDFIPRESSGLSHADLWELASECKEAYPPVQSKSEQWSEIAKGWEGLGVPIRWTDLEEIGEFASREAAKVEDLAVEGDHYNWMARYLDAVGRSWQATGGIAKSHVKHLLPDQHGNLHDFGQLQIDENVSDQVKDIAFSVGLDIRSKLLDKCVIQELTDKGLKVGKDALREATLGEMTEDDAVRDLVRHISEVLPEEKTVSEEKKKEAAASVKLLEHLWRSEVWSSQSKEAREVAWKVPLLAADRRAYRAGSQRLMVPPVALWHEAAKPFANAYPEGRILDDLYADAEGCKNVLEALANWGIAHHGLLTKSQRKELQERGLRAIAAEPTEVEDATLQREELTQIALLEPAVINHCKESRELAQALLGLIVCYVAPEDESWRSTVEKSVFASGVSKQVELTPSLWLADLKSKPWIPVEGEQLTQHVPTPELLRELIEPEWLEDNPDGADLLVRHFGMDALDVRLLAAAADEETRQRLRGGLARIIEIAGHNPKMIG